MQYSPTPACSKLLDISVYDVAAANTMASPTLEIILEFIITSVVDDALYLGI